MVGRKVESTHRLFPSTFFVMEKYPQQGGREAWEGKWPFFETMVPMLKTRIYQVESKN